MKDWRRTVAVSDKIFDYAKGGYRVMVDRGRPPVTRNNKTAAGMQRTSNRHTRGTLSHDALGLIVYGTLDPLRRDLGHTAKGCCPTCGSKNQKLVLTDKGRTRLKNLRARARARLIRDVPALYVDCT